MNCSKCGKDVNETDEGCIYCGAEQGTQIPPEFTEDKAQESSNKNEVVILAQRAMRGNDSVWGEIYEKTHRYVYFMAFKFLRSEQDAQDVTQEVYIQAIRSIGQLYTADSFFGWLRSIIFSKCKDLVKKKKPLLLDDDEDGGSPLDNMPEIGENFIPDMALDSAETRRMILELIDALPYAQRQAVMFFYYDDMTVDQIAALMECPTGTVKSRLNYARQQIKKGVEEHEKKGVKLYGIAALPILSILLREQAQAMSVPPTLSGGLAPILGHVAGSATTGSSTAGVVGTAAATTAKAAVPLLTKVIIGVLVTGAVIGGGVMLLTNNQDVDVTQPPEMTTPSAITSPTESQADEENPTDERSQIPADVRVIVERISEAFRADDRATVARLRQDPALKDFLSDKLQDTIKIADVVFGNYRTDMIDVHLNYCGNVVNGSGSLIQVSSVIIADHTEWLAGSDSVGNTVGMGYTVIPLLNYELTGSWEDAIYNPDGSLYYSESCRMVNYLLEGTSLYIHFSGFVDLDGHRYLQRYEIYTDYSQGLPTGVNRIIYYDDFGNVVSDDSSDADYGNPEIGSRMDQTNMEQYLDGLKWWIEMPNQ